MFSQESVLFCVVTNGNGCWGRLPKMSVCLGWFWRSKLHVATVCIWSNQGALLSDCESSICQAASCPWFGPTTWKQAFAGKWFVCQDLAWPLESVSYRGGMYWVSSIAVDNSWLVGQSVVGILTILRQQLFGYVLNVRKLSTSISFPPNEHSLDSRSAFLTSLYQSESLNLTVILLSIVFCMRCSCPMAMDVSMCSFFS